MLKIHMKTSELALNMKCWSCTELMRVATIYPEMMWRVQILFIHVLSIIHDSPDVVTQVISTCVLVYLNPVLLSVLCRVIIVPLSI